MYRVVPVIWNDDPKMGAHKLQQELDKHDAEGFALADTIDLGKVGAMLIFYNAGNDGYGDPEPLETDPDKIPVEPDAGPDMVPPHSPGMGHVDGGVPDQTEK